MAKGVITTHATFQAQTQNSAGNGGGGTMDDVLKRLGAVESTVSDIKALVSGLVATMPHLGTKSDLASLRTELKTDIAQVRTEAAEAKAELKTDIASVRTELAQMESSLIKWMIGTMLAAVSMAFVVARYVAP